MVDRLCLAWLLVVAIAYVSTWYFEPYTYAFTVMGLSALSAALVVAVLTLWIRSPAPRPAGRPWLCALLVALNAAAWLMLKTIHWA